MLFHFKNLSW